MELKGLEIGSTFNIVRGPGKPYKAHVIGVVDKHIVVYKWHGRHNKRWNYEADHIDNLLNYIDMVIKSNI